MTRKPPNPKPWYCLSCGSELPPDRQQGRCRECLIGKREGFIVPDSAIGRAVTLTSARPVFGKRP